MTAPSSPSAPARSYAFLGPTATFTEAALIRILTRRGELETAERVPMRSADLMLEAVRNGEVDAAVVPIENSVEGGVPATLDALTRHGRLQIVAEAVIPVRFVLAARPGEASVETLTSFGSHPHGEAQARLWLAEHAPRAEYRATSSTAAAAAELAAAPSAAEAPFQAAVCPLLAAETYGLEVLADDIGEERNAVTRFICVTRPGELPERTGADRTTFVVGLASDRAGALLEMLEQLAARGVNMSRIESRPTGNGLGLYQFSIDAKGHIAEARVAEAMQGIHRIAAKVQFLGSYPADEGEWDVPISAEAAAAAADPRVTDEAFAAAASWLEQIRRTGGLAD
ncbi:MULTISPECIES: prephenate dehydratase [Brevibacterium]|jgi:prephenate dehydratase|uniref:Prephenate dehydratase n=1 Tax=Brevibacterium salitolerans TaxID=1403566 RepID=A0ABN2WR17_9MICO|nr:prephenate dehydratase [Brevibacterium sp.]